MRNIILQEGYSEQYFFFNESHPKSINGKRTENKQLMGTIKRIEVEVPCLLPFSTCQRFTGFKS